MGKFEEEQIYSRFAEAVRDELIRAAIEGFEAGALDGLCPAGTMEAAISAMRRVDVPAIVKRVLNNS